MKQAFPPIIGEQSTSLILGSMPGEASLAAQQYYALPRNAFWGIMGELYGAPYELPYSQRVAILLDAGVAVWDVLAACERQGSLDSAIVADTLVANDFAAFLQRYPNIRRILFNGKSVRDLFRRHVLSAQVLRDKLEYVVLPSTSPANARLSFAEKLQQWREALG